MKTELRNHGQPECRTHTTYAGGTRVVQKVLSLIGLLSFILGIF